MAKRTPGRWRYGHTLTHGLAVFNTPAVGSPEHVVAVAGDNVADAQFIAGAPDLLYSLKEIVRLMEDTIESCGGYKEFFACDHSVGLCACGEKQVLRVAKCLLAAFDGGEK